MIKIFIIVATIFFGFGATTSHALKHLYKAPGIMVDKNDSPLPTFYSPHTTHY